MADVCAYASVSLRTLERLFCHELQVLPSGYILARRLENVRRALSSGKWVERTVTDIAMDHGFNHLGRFSAEYHRQFGVYPSHVRKKVFVCR
ncbi:MAG: helix-turn-helix domain-containing protein [Nitrospirota bacterium]|nr:helix-turn-helix domain-containing protein [Nitrospirota bacterium]